MENLSKAMRDSFVVRWGVLLFISFIMFANYYFYDALTPLKTNLQTNLGFNSTDYGIVTGFYAFSNSLLLMAIFGGIILDRYGIRLTGFLFVSFMTIGAIITFYATTDYFRQGGIGYGFIRSFFSEYSPEMKMMTLGMMIFGLGAETSIVVINKIMVKWFKGYEIALAFAVNLGIARFGTALAVKAGPRIETAYGWSTPLWLAMILILIAFLAFAIYTLIDLKIDRQLKEKDVTNETEKFRIMDVLNLFSMRSFIYITILCVTFYAAVFPFLKFAPDFFKNKYNLSEMVSADITFWLPIGTVLFTPIFGWFVDKKGKGASLMIYGSLILILVHTLFTFTTMNPYVLVIVLGIAFSLVPASMWPSVAKIVEEKKIGTAYGIMFSLQNLGLFFVPILCGKILDYVNKDVPAGGRLDYTYTILMFISFGVIAVFFSFLLKMEDKRKGLGMEYPTKK